MSERSLKDCLDSLPKSIVEQIESVSAKMKLDEKQKEKLIEEVVKEYFKSMYEPGEAIGIIAAQSISEPATQMCCDYNERIIVKYPEGIRAVKIGEFVNNVFDEFGFEKEGNYEICDLPNNTAFFVLSLDQNEKIQWKRIKACVRIKSPERLMKIKTKSGRQIIATDAHSFVIRKDNKIIPIRGDELKVGDRIPVIKYLPENCLESIDLYDFVESNRENSMPIALDKSFGWFIGAYLSEGSCSNSQVSIHNIDEDFLFNARNFASSLGINFKERRYNSPFGESHTLSINSSVFHKFIVNTCNKGSYNKRVPEFAYSAREEFVSSLLRGYFDGDGNVSVSRRMIRVSSNSEELIDGIKLLLTRFGIFAYKNKDKKQFSLMIPYKYAPIFLEKIGSDIKEKRERLEKLAKLAEGYWTNKSQDFNDMICGFGDIFYTIAKKLKYPTRYVNNFTKRQKIGRTTLYRYIKLFEKLAKDRNVDISKELEILKRMANSDVVWDEIVDISYVKPSSEYVYDISVDGLETFTTFDGIVTHNTMRTYHFAASAGIQVTLGLPRLIEIFDARKEPTTPMMTIYLKPAYNTKEKAEEFAKKIKEKRVKYYATELSVDLTNKKIKIVFGKAKKADMEEIVARLEKNLKDFNVKPAQNSILLEAKKDISIKELERMKRKILAIYVSGVEGVKNSVVVKEGDHWIVKTLGSNLQKIFQMDEVDATKTYSNNIHEVAEVLGIEAARNVLINEINNTLKQQGLHVDERHITVVVDIMCFTGEVRPIGRYGVAGSQSSVLARAGFEETIKHLVKASVRNEVDDFEGIFDNVMINQQIPAGTGMFELIAKMGEEE